MSGQDVCIDGVVRDERIGHDARLDHETRARLGHDARLGTRLCMGRTL